MVHSQLMVETSQGIVMPEKAAQILKQLKNPVIFLHFTFNGPSLPGVEEVIAEQMKGMKKAGYTPILLTGQSNFRDEAGQLHDNIWVLEQMRSGFYPLPEGNYRISEHFAREIKELKQAFMVMFIGVPMIVHNHTNAKRHNPSFGAAVKQFMEFDRSSAKIVWLHDFRAATISDLEDLLPDNRLPHVKIVTVSHVRKGNMEITLREAGCSQFIDTETIEVIANPIDIHFFDDSNELPATLEELAPQMVTNLAAFNLPRKELSGRNFADVLCPKDKGGIRIIVPARVVSQKNVDYVLDFAVALADKKGVRMIDVIITGPPDLRKSENEVYWTMIRRRIAEINQTHPAVRIYPLMGVERQYIPALYRQATFVLAPFVNEGWGYIPPEAALCGRPVIISPDPALIETTGGRAYVLGCRKGSCNEIIDSAPWRKPSCHDLNGVWEYYKGRRAKRHTKRLADFTRKNYSLKRHTDHVRRLLGAH